MSRALAGPALVDARLAFRDYIHAGRHLDSAGDFRGYDEIGAALGIGRSTAHRWMVRDFPGIVKAARSTAGTRGGAKRAKGPLALQRTGCRPVAMPEVGTPPLPLQGRYQARAAFRTFVQEGRHKGCAGFLGYREIAAELNTDPGTVSRWMGQDFPDIAQQIRGERRAVNAILRAIQDEEDA